MYEINYSPQQIREMSPDQLQEAMETQEFIILWENKDAADTTLVQPGSFVKNHQDFCLAHGPETYRLLRKEWDARGCPWIDPLEHEWTPPKISASDILRFAYSQASERTNPKSIDDLNT